MGFSAPASLVGQALHPQASCRGVACSGIWAVGIRTCLIYCWWNRIYGDGDSGKCFSRASVVYHIMRSKKAYYFVTSVSSVSTTIACSFV
ncbi:uncharacterized protein [Physcomitrium patens]|uniref:uncharacterized protein isoform X2 n=1 Tax=Physcomitrium patens TaxID=3218 RepID=UPI003CCE2CAA